MKCSCCGEEVGNVSLCPVCGQALVSAYNYPSSVATPKAQSGVAVFDKVANGVLEIEWVDSPYTYAGSGLLLSLSGYALTNAHVVTGANGKFASKVQVKLAGESVVAKVIAIGQDTKGIDPVDLALLMLENVPENAVSFEFADSACIKNGERVYVIGNSLGYGTCITEGIISDKLRNVDDRDLIMTDCAINHGNSGGPMFNEEGKVIGVVVAGIDRAEGMNFAIPSRTAVNFLRQCGVLSAIKKNF